MTIDILNTVSPDWMTNPARNCHSELKGGPDLTIHTEQWHPLPANERAATKLCRGCPVVNDCLAYALADPELIGIWGATTTGDRHKIRTGRDPLPIIGAGKNCGTQPGYEAHRRADTRPCRACRDAFNAYRREWRAARKDTA